MQRQTGRVPKALMVPDCPPEMWYIWEWFHQLSNDRRIDGMNGIECSITSQDIAHWSMVEKVTLTAFELQVIRRLDQYYKSPPQLIDEDDDDDTD